MNGGLHGVLSSLSGQQESGTYARLKGDRVLLPTRTDGEGNRERRSDGLGRSECGGFLDSGVVNRGDRDRSALGRSVLFPMDEERQERRRREPPAESDDETLCGRIAE